VTSAQVAQLVITAVLLLRWAWGFIRSRGEAKKKPEDD